VANAAQDSTFDQLFRTARSHNEWSDKPVSDDLIRQLYDLVKWGPTSANCCPARFVWVRSAEGKAKLSSLAMENNKGKILAAPVTVIVGYDPAFADTLPKLFPGARRDDETDIQESAVGRSDGDAEFKPTRRLSYNRCTRARIGLRTHVRL